MRQRAAAAIVCLVRDDHRGLLYGVTAHSLWGVFPLYFELMAPAGAIELVAYRLAGAFVGLAFALTVLARWRRLRQVGRNVSACGLLTGASVLIAMNWGTYLWAVAKDRVVEVSLGYFISPLVTIVLGVLFLGERLRRRQWTAVGLAALAVVVLTIDNGRPPWVALVIALSFGTYGLTKKLAGVDSVEGLAVETGILMPVAVVYLVWLGLAGESELFLHGADHVFLLTTVGLVTALPLITFGAAAIRLPLTTLGVLQYLTPTIQLVLGVVVLDEPMSGIRWAGIGLVWLALLVFTVNWTRHREPACLCRQESAVG